MPQRFIRQLITEIRQYAASLGKHNFLIFGEISTGVDSEIMDCVTQTGLSTALHYPAFRRGTAALHGRAPPSKLQESHAVAHATLGELADRMVTFIDNNDTYRFLLRNSPVSLARPALAYLLLSPGIPMLYYGSEQAFRSAGAEGEDQPSLQTLCGLQPPGVIGWVGVGEGCIQEHSRLFLLVHHQRSLGGTGGSGLTRKPSPPPPPPRTCAAPCRCPCARLPAAALVRSS